MTAPQRRVYTKGYAACRCDQGRDAGQLEGGGQPLGDFPLISHALLTLRLLVDALLERASWGGIGEAVERTLAEEDGPARARAEAFAEITSLDAVGAGPAAGSAGILFSPGRAQV